MTKHTPGPWAQPEIKRAHNRWHVEGGGRLVAAAGGPQFAIPADEADANARLIAVGPVLDDLVRRVVRAIDDSTIENVDGSSGVNPESFFEHDDLSNWLPEARAAIAKATR